ncbi:MAG TPA: hypothetical protein EYP79_03465 [Campylobacterales bacterium]|nr:hypothetical protein [Campylobacterales bacterium]
MKKIIFLFTIFITIAVANTANDKILKKLNNIQNDLNLIKQEMKLRFESIDKRFEAMDKRFEMMQSNIEKRFEAIDKRFEDINKRFEDINKRFEILTNFIMAITAGIFGLIGFMMWDRRTVVEKAKKECAKEVKESEEFNKKADKEYVDRLIKAMNELLVLKDETAINIFKKYKLL